MKFIPISFSLFFVSCLSTKMIPLKGSYPAAPIVHISDRPKDSVWDRLVDFFAQTGCNIKIIDRSSGLIVAGKASLPATYEDHKGIPFNKTAWVAVPHLKFLEENQKWWKRISVISGDWNVRIKNLDGKTSVNVNLVNIEMMPDLSSTRTSATQPVPYAKSTGIFEKMIFDELNK